MCRPPSPLRSRENTAGAPGSNSRKGCRSVRIDSPFCLWNFQCLTQLVQIFSPLLPRVALLYTGIVANRRIYRPITGVFGLAFNILLWIAIRSMIRAEVERQLVPS